MGIINKLAKESIRQNMIQQLMDHGIIEDNGIPVQDLDYYTLRFLLVRERIRLD
ncbi:hypothetical protein [Bacillus smithii]|uniref:hypothetical protein n=1 Tax=Bacillus smithii TaxID=1479 RepID=UPI0030C99B1D